MSKFYFTFGTDSGFSFKGGWVVVSATDRENAVKRFEEDFPPRKKNNNIVNCAWIYDQKSFEDTEMFRENDNLGYGCHKELFT